MSARKRIAHLGTFDVENYGDLLFPRLLERRLAGKGYEFTHVSPRGHSGVWADGASCISFQELRRRIDEFDGMIIGGGNLIHAAATRLSDYDHGGMSPLLAYSDLWMGSTLLAKQAGLPVCWNAPGVPGELPADSSGAIRWVLESADYLAVRDAASRDLLMLAAPRASASVVPDTAVEVRELWTDAELAEAHEAAFTTRGRELPERTLVFHFNKRFLGEGLVELAQRVDRVCESRGATPVLLAIGPCHGDGELVQQLAGSLRSAALVIDRPISLREVAACIGRSNGYLGSSLHGLITAVSFGVPAVLVAPKQRLKFSGFLLQLELEHCQVATWEEAERTQGTLLTAVGRAARHTLAECERTLDGHWRELERALSGDQSREREVPTFSTELDASQLPQLELASRELFDALRAANERAQQLRDRLQNQRRDLRLAKIHASEVRERGRSWASRSVAWLTRLSTRGGAQPQQQVLGDVRPDVTRSSGQSRNPARAAVKREWTAPPRSILLVNDTSATSNPGCKASVAAIRVAYSMDKDESQRSTLPLGYWADPFREVARKSSEAILKRAGQFPCGRAETGVELDLVRWDTIRTQLAKRDEELRQSLDGAELVVVNGEGSLHHDFPRALALLALCETAAERGLPVHLVNCTLQGMSERLLERVLPSLDLLHVRDPSSARLLQALGLPHVLTMDLAACARMDEEAPPGLPSGLAVERACLLTSGVLVNQRSLSEQICTIRRAGLEPVYFAIGDGGELQCASEVCSAEGVVMVLATDVPWRSTLSYLRSFPLAVSGRHHLNIFLARAGVPFIPLPSNTNKIEGTLQQMKYPMSVVKTCDELSTGLEQVLRDRVELAQAAKRSGEEAYASAAAFGSVHIPWN